MTTLEELISATWAAINMVMHVERFAIDDGGGMAGGIEDALQFYFHGLRRFGRRRGSWRRNRSDRNWRGCDGRRFGSGGGWLRQFESGKRITFGRAVRCLRLLNICLRTRRGANDKKLVSRFVAGHEEMNAQAHDHNHDRESRGAENPRQQRRFFRLLGRFPVVWGRDGGWRGGRRRNGRFLAPWRECPDFSAAATGAGLGFGLGSGLLKLRVRTASRHSSKCRMRPISSRYCSLTTDTIVPSFSGCIS